MSGIFGRFVRQAVATTGNHFAQNGAIINRVADRVLIGAAVENDAAFPNVNKDWLTTFQNTLGLTGLVVSAVAASLNNTAANAACSGLFGAHSAAFTSAGTSTIGVCGIAVNDNATLATKAWGGYFEAHRQNGTVLGAIGVEIDVRSINVSETLATPYQQSATIGLQLGAGCGVSAVGQTNIGAAIQIVNNPMAFRAGLVFSSGSIEGTDGSAGSTTNGVAIGLSRRHEIRWYEPTNGAIGASITSVVTATASKNSQVFADDQVYWVGAGNKNGFLINHTASGVNYLGVRSAVAGGPPRLDAVGDDTNIDLYLVPKGTGVLRFGAWTTNADAAVNGYVTIKDSSGNTRKLATIA